MPPLLHAGDRATVVNLLPQIHLIKVDTKINAVETARTPTRIE
jgi:hypothetical protein